MFEKILVVCVGNICRSPLAENLLKQALPGKAVSSAGLGALVGQDADPMSRAVAEAHGVDMPPHRARQLTPELCRQADLIFVMEGGHREAISHVSPESRGKIFLLGALLGGLEIADPYRKSQAEFERAYKEISLSVESWRKKLG